MPKVRRRDKKQQEILKKQGARFVDLPKRPMVALDIDMTGDGGEPKYTGDPDKTDDAVVKIVQRFHAGDEENANAVLKQMVTAIKERAHYLRPPERIVVREQKRRMEEIRHSLAPLDAAAAWLDRRTPKHIDRDEVLLRLKEYLENAPSVGELLGARPQPFAVRSLLVKDFMPFRGRYLIDGIEDGVFGVVGRYEGQDTRSNRAGKSALLDAILLALFGKGRDLESLGKHIHDGEEGLEVGIGIETGGELVPILRQIDRSTRGHKTSICVGDAEVGVNEGNAEIEKIIGMKQEDFLQTCYVKQGDLISILDKTSGQLKADIIRWKHLNVWTEIAQAVGRDAKKISDEVDGYEYRLAAAQGRVELGRPDKKEIAKTRGMIEEAERRNKEIAAAEARYKGLKRRVEQARKVEEAQKVIEGAEGLDERLKELRKQLQAERDRNRRIETAKAEVRHYERLFQDHEEFKGWRATARKYQARKTKLDSLCSVAKEKAEELSVAQGHEAVAQMETKKCRVRQRSGFDGVCPVDSAQCPRSAEINADEERAFEAVKEAEAVLDSKRKARKKAEEVRNQAQGKVDAAKSEVDESKRADEQVARMIKANPDLDGPPFKKWQTQLEKNQKIAAEQSSGQTDGISDEIQQVERLLDAAKEAAGVVKASEETETRAELEFSMKEAEQDMDIESYQVGELQDQLAEQLARVKLYDEAVAEVQECEAQLKGRRKEAAVLAYLKHLCGKQGIPSMMVEDALIEIADKVNDILEGLGTDHRLEFHFERELQRPARTCLDCGFVFPESERIKHCEQCGAERGREKSDELRPMVREGDRLQEYDQDSGAGRALLALATRVVLSQFLGATVLFLDEVSGMLDDYHLPMLIRLLRRLPDLGFSQVFIISHQKEVAEALPRNLLILRIPTEGRSELTWEVAA